VKDILPGALGSYPRNLVAWNSRLYFSAHDVAHGMELWTSDGTAAGTRLVHDVSPGPSWSTPRELTVANGSLYFSAHDGEHGRELWELPDQP
jgi:ELWxxDGT repeat protein